MSVNFPQFFIADHKQGMFLTKENLPDMAATYIETRRFIISAGQKACTPTPDSHLVTKTSRTFFSYEQPWLQADFYASPDTRFIARVGIQPALQPALIYTNTEAAPEFNGCSGLITSLSIRSIAKHIGVVLPDTLKRSLHAIFRSILKNLSNCNHKFKKK